MTKPILNIAEVELQPRPAAMAATDLPLGNLTLAWA